MLARCTSFARLMTRRFAPPIAAALLALVVCRAPAASAAERPNILFLFADDWGRQARIYAEADGPGSISDAVRTPHFDRLAREGVLFRNAFVNAPSCTPCRSSLLTGQYFWRTGRGAILRGAVWDDSIPSYPLLLHADGYHIGQTYKVWSPGSPVDAPYGGSQFAYERGGGRFNRFSQQVTQMVAKGRPLEEAKRELVAEAASNFTAFLQARKPGQPFCYWLGPTNVHRAWQQGSGKKLWNIDPDSLRGKMPAFLPDVPEVREDLADYLGEVQAFDMLLGAVLEELQRHGELDNTVIAVSGDHGPPGFPHGKCNLYDFGTAVALAIRGPGIPAGRVVDDLVSLPDLAATFVELAGLPLPESMTASSLVSVLQSVPRLNQSRQVDPQRTWVLTGRERHVDSARDEFRPYPQRALRTHEYLYIVNFEPDRWPLGAPYGLDDQSTLDPEALATNTRVTLRDMDAGPTKAWLVAHRHEPEGAKFFQLAFGKRPGEELYVLADDPHQVRNVAQEAKFAEVRQRLRGQLMDELRRSGDPRIVDDGAYFENPPLGGPGSEAPR